jgi:hypothetical protein
MNIIDFLNGIWGNTNTPKTEFGKFVEKLGAEKVKVEMESFKRSEAYVIILKAFRTIEDVARKRMVDIDPKDDTGITRCQDYACLRSFYEWIVDDLSTAEIENRFKEDVHMDAHQRPLL